MTQHSEGTIFLVWTLPSEWPPRLGAELLSTAHGNAMVRLIAHTDGHLSFSIEIAGSLTQHHFRRLVPTGPGNVVLTAVWGGAEGMTLFINGDTVPAADDSDATFGVTPNACPVDTKSGVEITGAMLAAVTDLERLFLETLRDLELRVQGGSPYDLMRASALLRQLLTDQRPLLNEVNRHYQVPVRFTITERPAEPPPFNPAFHHRRLVPSSAPTTTVTLAQLLQAEVMTHEGLRFSVLDLIRTMAHVFGGVHNQLPESMGEHRLLQLAKQIKTGSTPLPHSAIKDIALVTVQGMLPLVSAIAERYRNTA